MEIEEPMDIKKNEEYWRNRGEQDRIQNRKYRKPHGFFSALITWSMSGLRKEREDNLSYDHGWNYPRVKDSE